jgi:hypothetical protein
MLEDGTYATIAEIAAAEKINLSYLCRVLRLTLLAPDIVEAVLNGRLMPFLLSDLLQPISLVWDEQWDKLKGIQVD